MRVSAAFAVILGALTLLAGTSPAADSGAKPGTSPLDNDPHLVGWWKLDETSGSRVADSSSHGRHAVLEGGLAFDRPAAPGGDKEFVFDGKQAQVRVTGFKGVSGVEPRTISVWIKTSKPNGEIVSWGAGKPGKMWTMCFIRNHLGVTPKGGQLYMKAAVQDNAWHHVAAVVEKASPPNLHDNVKLYLDGEPAEIDDIGLLDLWPIETGVGQDVLIGRAFQGSIGDLRLYDRALSEDEIKILSRSGGHSLPSLRK